ncbi:MAG: hypothetical protein WC862_04115 [Patescibacteria group bacterium]
MNKKTKENIKDTILVIGAIIAAVSSIYAIKSFFEAKKTGRPYLSIVERNDVLKFNTDYQYNILKATIKNTGNLPAKFNTSLNGWPCSSTPLRADSDYISPNQEIELGYNLLFNCKLPSDNMCGVYENIKLEINYKTQDLDDFDYSTSFKMKIIPGTKDMIELDSTSSGKYDFAIIRCGGNDQRTNLVATWYIDEMK